MYKNEGICPEKYKNRRETSLAIALLSATFATLMCYPLDTVRSQMQMKGTPHNTVLMLFQVVMLALHELMVEPIFKSVSMLCRHCGA